MSGTRRGSRFSRGYFGIAVYQPKTEANVGTLWRSAFLFGAAFIATVGHRYERQGSDTPGTPNHVPLLSYSTLDDLVTHLPYNCPLVGVELAERATALTQFAHPLRAVYLLGAEDRGLPPAVLERCHHVVQIPGVRDWSMNVSVAGSIVMYDRFAKADSVRASVRA